MLMIRCCVISLWILLLISCTKHEQIEYHDFIKISDKELSGIWFTDSRQAYVVGGTTWSAGITASTQDTWKHWQVDSLSDKELFCIYGTSGGQVIGMGIELWAYHLNESPLRIQKLKHTGSFRFIRSIAAFNDQLIMAVNANGTGSIERFSIYADSTQTVFESRHELNAICYIDSSNWLAAGYGLVVHSNNAGKHWDTLDISGDQFVDFSKTAQGNLFMLGVAGTVYKIVANPVRFIKIRKGGIIGSRAPLKAICFKNEKEGMIAGENGTILITRNSGDDWIVLDDLPVFDVKDIYFDGTYYWLCGSEGSIMSLDINN
ncbi:MAG TPA: hypothetical protein PLS73_07540 [Saprospiraceae bacterium]|nr:hypothetical protein [Saprospiraceae bacterium]